MLITRLSGLRVRFFQFISDIRNDRFRAAMDQTIRVAVIGCGYWGPNHIRNFSQIDNCEVVCIADLCEQRLAEIHRRFPDICVSNKPLEVLESSDIDAVVIATPTLTHFELVRLALQSGKHILCEKPLCTQTSEASELAELAKSNGLTLVVGHVFLFSPGIVCLKSLVDSGRLGKIRTLSATRTNLGPVRTDVNASFDLASHDVSIFNWLLNSVPIEVSATGGSFLKSGNEDTVFVSLSYPEGQIAGIHASWLNPRKVRQITIAGDTGMAAWDDLASASPVTLFESRIDSTDGLSTSADSFVVRTDDGVAVPIESGEPLRLQAECFVDGILTEKIVRSGSEFAVGVVRVLDAVNKSLELRGQPVSVPLD